jgi:hypothetical protein
MRARNREIDFSEMEQPMSQEGHADCSVRKGTMDPHKGEHNSSETALKSKHGRIRKATFR